MSEKKEFSEAELIKIELLATQFADISHIIERDPTLRMYSMAIAVGFMAASLGFSKTDMETLMGTYYDKTDKVLTELEKHLSKDSEPKPRVIKTETLN